MYDYLDLWDSEEASSCLNELFTTEPDERTKVRIFEGDADIFSAIISGQAVQLPYKILLFSVMKRIIRKGKVLDEALKDYARIIRNYMLSIRQFVRKKCVFQPDFRYGRRAIPFMQNFIEIMVDEDDLYQALCDIEFEGVNEDVGASKING